MNLGKYTFFTAPNYQSKIVHNQKEDYEAVESFNKSMSVVRQEYSAKEKLSYESAEKIMLTD